MTVLMTGGAEAIGSHSAPDAGRDHVVVFGAVADQALAWEDRRGPRNRI
ncbi:hypothetical protein [Methylobacterium pseudosasicola]|uniref:Uncharacterized protein n=1 Tax=Methylobacterium pseudosasicola TaxID=582667 RepID=A0A1I4JN58_9HYPH|nr:hypothetical protein [Methylobacterium pseudosasicola]SFL67972.1 hypothetical protein SAMN05192568_1008155 [Methylobacterium pseudosasicola]